MGKHEFIAMPFYPTLSTCWISSSICDIGPWSLSHTCVRCHLNTNQLKGRKFFKKIACDRWIHFSLNFWCTIVVINVNCVGSDNPIGQARGWPFYQQSMATEVSHYDPCWSTGNCEEGIQLWTCMVYTMLCGDLTWFSPFLVNICLSIVWLWYTWGKLQLSGQSGASVMWQVCAQSMVWWSQ